MAIQIVALKDGQLGTSADAELYAVPEDKTAIVKSIRIVNTDTSARTLNIYYRKSGSTSRRILPKDLSLPAGACFEDDLEITMEGEDSIRGDGSVASKLDYVISGVEREET
jgi:hypothetical protein